MTRILERRLRRLEQARGTQDDDECPLELSPAGRAQLEETLAMMKQRRPQPAVSDIASGASARLV